MPMKPCLGVLALLLLAAVGGRCAFASRFEGFSALVVEPENFWGWDTAVLCALEDKGFDVTYGRIPERGAELARYALVALTIRRSLTDGEAALLADYVESGGALYGSWGGPMGEPQFLREVCGVAGTRSVWLHAFELVESPLSEGIPLGEVVLLEHVGHLSAPARGWEIVAVAPASGGIPVATDAEGRCLGVLNEHGRGRTAVLGFGPEQDKHYASADLAPRMLDNLLGWLLQRRLAEGGREWSGRLSVALPARAEVGEVRLDGRPVPPLEVRRVGSLRTVELDVSHVADGDEVTVEVGYQPIRPARNVEAVVHLPWGTLVSAADSPGRLADYLASLGATVCQPLLRDANGRAWYRGLPQDDGDQNLVQRYDGDFLADLVAECHARGIRVIGGLYFDNATPVREHPDVKRVGRDGNPVKDRWGRFEACFNNRLARQHNLETVRHLLASYDLDGVILDDNFELDQQECFCDHCKAAFRAYCEERGAAYEDPAGTLSGPAAELWREHRREATRRLAAEVHSIAREHGVPAGGWVGASMGSMHLASVLDFLGGMVYTQPPRAARGPLLVLGERDFICLLWAPDADPARMEREVREAVHVGCAAVGFWIRGEDGGYEMDAERTAAMRRALGRVEQDWLDYYRRAIVGGDGRFAIVDGSVGPGELRLRLRNTGAPASRRFDGQIPEQFGPAH